MKKLIALLLTAIVLASCSAQTDDNSASTSAQSKPQDCTTHRQTYHSLANSLMKSVGNDKAVSEWIQKAFAEKPQQKGCIGKDANIYAFVREFNIPKETFIEIYNSQKLTLDYPIDLIYDGTLEEVEKYYSKKNKEIDEELLIWSSMNQVKMDLIIDIMKKSGESFKYFEHSLVELAQKAGKTPDEIADALKLRSGLDKSPYDMAVFEKDTKALMSEHSHYYLDCMICGFTPYETPYERQVNENK